MYLDNMHYSHYIYCTDTINVANSQVSQVAVIRIVSTRQRCQYDWLGSIGVDGVQVAIEHGVASTQSRLWMAVVVGLLAVHAHSKVVVDATLGAVEWTVGKYLV